MKESVYITFHYGDTYCALLEGKSFALLLATAPGTSVTASHASVGNEKKRLEIRERSKIRALPLRKPLVGPREK